MAEGFLGWYSPIYWVELCRSNPRFNNRVLYLTIIPRTCGGYELLDNGRDTEHQVGYHKLISNKPEWNNCFIKYQTLDKNISNFNLYRLKFSAILRERFP